MSVRQRDPYTQESLSLGLDRTDPTTVVLRPVGEVDVLTGPLFRDWLVRNLTYHARVVLDLSGLSLCSREGLNILEDAQRMASRQYVVLLVLASATHPVRHRHRAVGSELHLWDLEPADALAHAGTITPTGVGSARLTLRERRTIRADRADRADRRRSRSRAE